jgi:hypothetical protein
MPVVLAGAVIVMVASPLPPAIGLIFTQPKPVVSILHSSLQVNDRDLVPPLSGMVSVIFEIESSGETFVFFQELIAKRVIKMPAIP